MIRATEALNAWLRDPAPERFPYDAVLRELQRTGKHFLAEPLLTALGRARAACPVRAQPLRAFLDCALDKRDGRYSYRSYLCLPLLEQLALGPQALVSLLVADALRYELAAHGSSVLSLPEGRPEQATRHKRYRYGLRLLGLPAPEVERLSGTDGPELARVLPEPGEGVVAERLRLSLQPVYVLHDEYLFLRVLQSYETVFAALVRLARVARDLLRRGQAEGAVAALTGAADQLDRAGLLFSLLATMDIGAFRRFREYTVGSSAIQSEQYKRFECLCGSPRPDRWQSPAFGSVPVVAAQTAADPDTITAAYLAARAARCFTLAQWVVVDAALARLEHSHQHWKATHHTLAARMIGEASGSGYTEGVPYLQACLDNRLFWRLGERYLPTSRQVP